MLNFWMPTRGRNCRKCAANKPRKESPYWGHEESLERLFICQHVSIEVCKDYDKRVRVGGNGGPREGRKGNGKQEGRHEELTGHVYEEGIDPAGLFSKVTGPSALPS